MFLNMYFLLLVQKMQNIFVFVFLKLYTEKNSVSRRDTPQVTPGKYRLIKAGSEKTHQASPVESY